MLRQKSDAKEITGVAAMAANSKKIIYQREKLRRLHKKLFGRFVGQPPQAGILAVKFQRTCKAANVGLLLLQ